MDLALLVYVISLISGFSFFLGVTSGASAIAFFILSIVNAEHTFSGSEYSWNLNRDGTLKESVVQQRKLLKRFWKISLIVFVLSAIINILIPSEKTAYTMVGAYATQKIAEDSRTQEIGGKVLTIINQKLDSYVEEGIKKAEDAAKAKTK